MRRDTLRGRNIGQRDFEYNLAINHPEITITESNHSHPDAYANYPSGFNPNGSKSSFPGDRQNAQFFEKYYPGMIHKLYLPSSNSYVRYDSEHIFKDK
jgi:hypothetical protein